MLVSKSTTRVIKTRLQEKRVRGIGPEAAFSGDAVTLRLPDDRVELGRDGVELLAQLLDRLHLCVWLLASSRLHFVHAELMQPGELLDAFGHLGQLPLVLVAPTE